MRSFLILMQPCAAVHCLDSLGWESLPHSADGVSQRVIVGIDVIAEFMVFEPMPQAFHHVELRTVRRQRQQRDVGRHPQMPRGMPAGIVQHQHPVPLGPRATPTHRTRPSAG